MTDVVRFESLEVEALAEIANESAGQVESFARKAVEQADRCGRALIAIKAKLPHGEWGKWLGANFDYSQQHASRYMVIAENYARVSNLKDATSIRQALQLIADDPDTPKRGRKASVEVVEVRDVASEVAAECGVTRKQIIRDGEYAAAVDKVAETIPDIRQKVRSGEVSQTDVIDLANAKSTNRDDKPVRTKRKNAQREEHRDMLDMFEDMKKQVRDAMHEFPEAQQAIIWRQLVEQLSEEHYGSGQVIKAAKAKPTEPQHVKAKPAPTSLKVDEIVRLYADKVTRSDQVMDGIRRALAIVERNTADMTALVRWVLSMLTEEELMDVFLICKGTRANVAADQRAVQS